MVEQGEVELSECPSNSSWTSVFAPDRRFAVDHPLAWSMTHTRAGSEFVHPNAWLSLHIELHEAANPLEAYIEHRDFEFESADLISQWSDKAHRVGRISDGVLRRGEQMVIVRYLVSDTHFLEASVSTDRMLDEDCRRHVMRLMSSIKLITPDAKPRELAPEPTPAKDLTPPGVGTKGEASPAPPAPRPFPKPTPATSDALPLDLRPQGQTPEPDT